MTDDIDHTLLAAYLADECTAEAAAQVRAWIMASRENAEAFQEFEALWRAAPSAAIAWDVDTAWQKVRHDFRDQRRLMLTPSEPAIERSDTKPRQMASRLFRHRSGLWAAAVAALLVGVSGVMLDRVNRPAEERVGPLSMRDVTTRKGQRTSVRLSDGTRVLLSVDSKLRFPSAFGARGREVYLEGEAFFDVAPDSNKPFIIHAAGAFTQVLGTKFSLRAYAGDSGVRVAVAEGRVRLRPGRADSAAGVVLTRNQLGQLGSDGRVGVRRNVDIQRYTGWIGGRIVFEDRPLREVRRELERWYDADFLLMDSDLDSLRLTAAFRQEPLDVVVRAIARTLDLEAQRAGSAIVFSRRSRVEP